MVPCRRCTGFHLLGPKPVAGRDAKGDIRLSGGKGELIAIGGEHSREDIQGWHDRATEVYWRQKYAAALALLDHEDQQIGSRP
jgi:hypothetical protein